MNAKTRRNVILCVRVCLAGAGIGLLVLAGICFRGAYKIHGEIEELKKPLVEMAIDLSQAGTYSAVLGPVKAHFHGIGLHIEIETAQRNREALQGLFEGVGGAATITDGEGKVVCELAVAEDELVCYPARSESDERAWATFLDGVPEYAAQRSVLTLEIDRPAEALAGVKQKVIVRYDLCGLESLGLFFASVLGVAATAAGFTLAGLGAVPLVRGKRKDR